MAQIVLMNDSGEREPVIIHRNQLLALSGFSALFSSGLVKTLLPIMIIH